MALARQALPDDAVPLYQHFDVARFSVLFQ